MELYERRFLTAADLRYLEDIELSLVRMHGIAPERVAPIIRPIVADLQRERIAGSAVAAALIFAYVSPTEHAEALAALLIQPRAPSGLSLASLALMAAVAGLLGMRVVLAFAFRRFDDVRIGLIDVTLAVVVVGVILLTARSLWLPARLGRKNWIWVSLVLGIALGIGATIFLRALHVQHTLLTMPLWLAGVVAAVCGGLTWLFTWPDDQRLPNP